MSTATFQQGIQKDWTTRVGLRAVVLMTSLGYHCGYVGVPADNPLHGAVYDKPCDALVAASGPIGKRSMLAVVCAAGNESRLRSPELVFDVHGGITYSGDSALYPAPNDGLWWFGYDCGHAGDVSHPGSRYGGDRYEGAEFRDLDYCIAECEALAEQIVQATGAAS